MTTWTTCSPKPQNVRCANGSYTTHEEKEIQDTGLDEEEHDPLRARSRGLSKRIQIRLSILPTLRYIQWGTAYDILEEFTHQALYEINKVATAVVANVTAYEAVWMSRQKAGS